MVHITSKEFYDNGVELTVDIIRRMVSAMRQYNTYLKLDEPEFANKFRNQYELYQKLLNVHRFPSVIKTCYIAGPLRAIKIVETVQFLNTDMFQYDNNMLVKMLTSRDDNAGRALGFDPNTHSIRVWDCDQPANKRVTTTWNVEVDILNIDGKTIGAETVSTGIATEEIAKGVATLWNNCDMMHGAARIVPIHNE